MFDDDDIPDHPEVSTEPKNRLTRLAAVMTDALEADPEYTDDIKVIVLVNTPQAGGIQIHGYEHIIDAMADLLYQMKIIFEAHGKRLDIFGVDDDGVTRISNDSFDH